MRKRIVSVLFALIMAASTVLVPFASYASDAAPAGNAVGDTATGETAISSEGSGESYQAQPYTDYISQYADAAHPDTEIVIDATKYLNTKNVDGKSYTSMDGLEVTDNLEESGKKALITKDEGVVTWQFDVATEGLYNLSVNYYPIEGKGSNIERTMMLDETLPFEEVRSIVFSRLWKDEGDRKYSTEERNMEKSPSGNEYRPNEVEIREWTDSLIKSSNGFYDDSFSFYLTKGTHTISFESLSEPMAINSLKFCQVAKDRTYAEILDEYNAKGYTDATEGGIKIQAENATKKSDDTLYPIEDRSSPINEPYSNTLTMLNSIGGNNWNRQGDWIEWTIDGASIKQSGLYNLYFRTKQNFKSGIIATRTLYINGEVPFEEARHLQVKYNSDWQIVTFSDSDSNPLKFYFEAGKDYTLRLENTIGALGDMLRSVQTSVTKLNTLYRQMKMIVGSNPDANRDYNLDKHIPTIYDTLKNEKENLADMLAKIESISGGKGDQSSYIETLNVQIELMLDNKTKIPSRLGTFNDDISSVASWVMSASEQSIMLDYIYLSPSAADASTIPTADAKWYEKFWNECVSFCLSFVTDYNFVEKSGDVDTSKGEVTLWLSGTAGRDQASVVKNLADNYFARDYNINLNIRLVDMGVLLRAVSAGEGPDVAIYQDYATPVNYGVRSALYDLYQFDDTKEVLKRFYPSSYAAYILREPDGTDSLYALPETQSFPMLFYRKDVIYDLGLQVPNVWSDFYSLIPVLSQNNLTIAIPSPAGTTSGGTASNLNPIYMMFLLQRDGTVYNEDYSRCILNSKQSVSAFVEWSELFTKFKLPITVNATSYFRTGEAPFAIQDYTFYNSLIVAAPEISGLWGMAPIPGTEKTNEDGTTYIDRSCASGGGSCVMFKNAKDPESCWEFMKWWTSADIQKTYGNEMEALQGISARIATANVEAMDMLPWPSSASKAIKEEWSSVVGIHETAGSYYVGRQIDNAVKSVVNNAETPRETLMDYVDTINEEIINKRREFGYEEEE